eukprot:CAMPEP_0119147380 /NCGR_PEP_ID=MMETSP1310-20130426/40266_1 /TAXON_ID=464262 /ORGANISM="Genus nov. species nov., Strain RCC2339" /LENGTH=142 /DNA_ID=CAMNT_0007139347 /DNA_START=36 /DNA_END=461 /DNA_ORIENTATION=-
MFRFGIGLRSILKESMRGKGLGRESVEQIMEKFQHIPNRPKKGLVIKAGLMDKTVTVAIDYLAPRRGKYRQFDGKVKRRVRLLVHDEENACRVGDHVLIRQSRPISRRKHHIIYAITKKEPGRAWLDSHPDYEYKARPELRK